MSGGTAEWGQYAEARLGGRGVMMWMSQETF
jgi:hypothetical protein